MNNSIIPLLIIGAFGAFLIFQNRAKAKILTPPVPTFKTPIPGTRRYNEWIQASLNQIMESNLIADGTIGPLTKKVIREFQELAGLYPVDGIVGPQTQTAIEQFLEGL